MERTAWAACLDRLSQCLCLGERAVPIEQAPAAHEGLHRIDAA
jgi:hypothetical protein